MPEQDLDIDLQNVHGDLTEWIVQPGVERKIRRLFCNFLLSFEEEGAKVYQQKIKQMKAGEGCCCYKVYVCGGVAV